MQLARAAKPKISSRYVRNTFLEYFCGDHGHRLVRGCPVLPYADPTLAFVNAGMNQFKGALLGTLKAPARRVANSQKCVRVGGKHNDLVVVGRDATHHTFFEMLGNWSFGDYFKKDACCMAWELLTEIYNIPASSLHVTYFGGDPVAGLGPDLETYDIWRTIGVPDERITPGLARDNFWEMGDTGPCGGCTEIHFIPHDKPPTPENMLELWNLVFIEYERLQDGSLKPLTKCHVDTGLGLERITAVLQGSPSNYDSDLFQPLFKVIEKMTGRPGYSGRFGPEEKLDTAYRILADHCRMATVCLADGFIPDQEGKLRGIIRKALTVSRDVFGKEEDLLNHLAACVTEILSDAYPEMSHRLSRVQHILSQEAELVRSLRSEMQSEWQALSSGNPQLLDLPVNECPNLVPAYKRLLSTTNTGNELEPARAWSICETFGVPPYLAQDLAKSLGLTLNEAALESEMLKSKEASRKQMYEQMEATDNVINIVETLRRACISPTDDSPKYSYSFTFQKEVNFPKQEAIVVALIVNGQLVDAVTKVTLSGVEDKIGVVLDRTNVFSEEGGQLADHGTIQLIPGPELEIYDAQKAGEYVIHWIKPESCCKEISIGSQCLVSIDETRRKSLMNNHTATHLLNAALKNHLIVSDQKSSRVSPDKLRFDFSVYRETLNHQGLMNIEKEIKTVIRHDVVVERGSVSSNLLPLLNPITTLPGETYPYRRVHIIQINSGFFLSREPCCGTHALRTSHLEDFVITHLKSLSSSVKSVQAVTGREAKSARKNSQLCWDRVHAVEKEVKAALVVENNEKQIEMCDAHLGQLANDIRALDLLGHVDRENMIDYLQELKIKLKYSARGYLRNALDVEMKKIVEENQEPYLIYLLQCSNKLDDVPLVKASKFCPDKPALLLSMKDGVVKARCTVPKTLVTSSFSAQLWMKPLLEEFRAGGGPPRGQDPDLVYNMKAIKLKKEKLDTFLQKANSIVKKIHLK